MHSLSDPSAAKVVLNFPRQDIVTRPPPGFIKIVADVFFGQGIPFEASTYFKGVASRRLTSALIKFTLYTDGEVIRETEKSS